VSLLANVGKTDKILRIAAGVVLVAATFLVLGGLSTTAGIVASLVGVVLIATAAMNFCPAYKILGLSTCKQCD